ncbi:hypothetical protein [Reyranella sp.]|uniref:hypothetical protein n=1 Tax=Reyranella sp. TaxID=1929291 RepID=UPI0026010A06|nr:hypothetical protein [Reyranella sp.]
MLDEAYRLAHLPLMAPDHPDVIQSRAGTIYRSGRHERIFSLVLPVPPDALEESAAYQELERELRHLPFGHKIAWDLLAKRRERLHATICGSLSKDVPYRVSDDERAALSELGRMRVEVRGLFSGNINVGRLYLRIYPECRNGMNLLRRIQRTLGRPETDLYLVGLFNFVDHLDPVEAGALRDLIERWWDRPILTLDVAALWLLGATDDLVLDAGVEDVISLE